MIRTLFFYAVGAIEGAFVAGLLVVILYLAFIANTNISWSESMAVLYDSRFVKTCMFGAGVGVWLTFCVRHNSNL